MYWAGLSEEDRLFVLEGAPATGPASGSSAVATRDTTKWNMNENIRLALCLFETFHEAGGISFLSYFRERRERVNLDLDEKVADEQLTKVFNDPTMHWSYPDIDAVAKFDPHMHSQVCFSRTAVDVSTRVLFLRAEVQNWSEAFTRSGERGIVEWDWSVHPIAEVIYKVDPSAIQCMTSCIVSGGLPAGLAEVGLPQRREAETTSEVTGTESTGIDDQAELCSSVPTSRGRTSSQSSGSHKKRRVTNENEQALDVDRFDRLANSLEVFASSVNRLAETLASRQTGGP